MRVRVALVTAVAVLLSSQVGAAEPGAACQARKLRATGKAGRALIGCAAVLWDPSRPSRCDGLAGVRLARTFDYADRHRCVTTGDGPRIRSDVEAFASTVASTVAQTQPRPSACVGTKLEASADKFFAVMNAQARNKRRPDADRLAAALAQADTAFLAAFDAANALGGCVVSDDAEKARENERVDIWAAQFVRLLSPVCGDNVRAITEECDGSDGGSCPGFCTTACTCPVCGNGVIEPGEQCDGTADALCPGACTGCDCPGPPICGDNVREAPEQCDGSAPGCAIGGFADTCVPAGQPRECSCCSTVICNFEGFPIPCCPGLNCVSTGGPHVQAICRAP
jgi:hypothetical protein